MIQVQIGQDVICRPGQFFKFDLTEQLDKEKLKIVEAKNDHSVLQIKNLSSSNDFMTRQPLLARPYSVGLCENTGKQTPITFLYKILGPGSKRLSDLNVGQTLTILGPLGGNSFYLPKKKKCALMVAGGVGLPPLLFLSRQLLLLSEGISSVHLFVGANTSDKLPLHADFAIGKNIKNVKGLPAIFQHLADPRMTIQISTDDGSEGHRGLATELLEQYLKKNDGEQESVIYTCGPWRMMARTAAIAGEHHLPCQVSLEEMMGCGIGACQGCATKIKSGNAKGWEYKLVCRDGPVFDANDVYWDKE
ncbi:MAG: hypothetical protein WC975_03830 [Phycisphaerae bacterium]